MRKGAEKYKCNGYIISWEKMEWNKIWKAVKVDKADLVADSQAAIHMLARNA